MIFNQSYQLLSFSPVNCIRRRYIFPGRSQCCKAQKLVIYHDKFVMSECVLYTERHTLWWESLTSWIPAGDLSMWNSNTEKRWKSVANWTHLSATERPGEKQEVATNFSGMNRILLKSRSLVHQTQKSVLESETKCFCFVFYLDHCDTALVSGTRNFNPIFKFQLSL